MQDRNKVFKSAALSLFLFCCAHWLPISAYAVDAGVTRKGVNTLAVVYGILAVLSLMLVVGYVLWDSRRERKFLMLYICVAVVNCGYFLLAVSETLVAAMVANAVSYLGAAYLMLLMLFIILEVCNLKLKPWKITALIIVSSCAFALAASGDLFGLYYSSVSLEFVRGATKLIKVYGPLHILYPLYLLSYLLMMAGAVVYAASQKLLPSLKHAVLLLAVVVGNLGVWLFGQLVDGDFEFLSISYIITEVILLLLCGLLRDYGIEHTGIYTPTLVQPQQQADPGGLPPNMEELFSQFLDKVATLSTAEMRILNYYIQGYETADIPDLAYISIHTVKKHNRSIYQKLDIASRDELMLYIELFRRCERLDEISKAGE